MVRIGDVRPGEVRSGTVRCVTARQAGRGLFRYGAFRFVMVVHGRYGCLKGDEEMVYERKYSWRVSHGVSADVAGKVMEEIEARDGEVTKEAFLEASRPEDSPTHNCFEWDDSQAAELYRLNQAYHVILDLEVTVTEAESGSRSSAFVNVIKKTPTESAKYKSLDVAMADEELRMNVIRNALAEFKAVEKKYNHLVELSSIFTAIDSAERRYS